MITICPHACVPAVNPELFSLYCRVKTIYSIAGGEVDKKPDKKKMNEFDFKKSLVIAKINDLDEVRAASSDALATLLPITVPLWVA